MRNLDTSSTLSAANWAGYTTLVNDRSTGAVVFDKVGTNATVSVDQAGADTTVQYAADAMKGTSDTVAVTLNAVTAGTVTLTAAGAEAIENITVAVSGKNTVTDIVGATKKVTITGSGSLSATNDLGTNVDGSAATGKLTLKTANVASGQDATTDSVDTVDVTLKAGSANDALDISANAADNEIDVDAGAGDDAVTIKAATAYAKATATNVGDKIAGGAGTDTLIVAGNLDASDLSASITGFEVVKFTGDASGTDMSVNKLAINEFVLSGADTDVTLTGLAAGAKATIGDDGSDLAATIGTDTTADTLNVVLESTSATTGSALTATNYETLNLSSVKAADDAATVQNRAASITASSATKLVISGDTKLTVTTATLKADAAIDASAMTADLTISALGANVKTYTGGSGKDAVTLVAGGLKQGNTFNGGAGTDTLSATATAAQNLGILAVSGFETIAIASNAASGDTVTADFRNVTDATKIEVTAGDAGDSFTLNRVGANVTAVVKAAASALTLTNESGQAQSVALGASVGTLTVDSAASTLNIQMAQGASSNVGLTTLAGNSLTTIVVTDDGVSTGTIDLGSALSTVTKIDASALTKAAVNADLGAAGTLIGGEKNDNLTGSAGKDTITGGKGDDTLSGGDATDTFIFGTEKTNGSDVLTIKVGAINTGTASADGDILNFAAFLSGGTVDQNGATGTEINEYTSANTGDVNITGKVALFSDATAQTAANIAALIDGSGDAFSLTSGGKAIVISGDPTDDGIDTGDLRVFFVFDANNDGDVADTNEVVLVGSMASNFDVDAILTTNFAFA